MPPKILVVDDEPDLQLLIKQRFRKHIQQKEFEFCFANDGIEALEALKNDNEIDLVLTDINMPNMDGLSLLSKIREKNSLLKVVIVSAYGDLDNIRTAMNRGAFDFVTKPIDFQDLEITIHKSINELQTLKNALQARDQLVAIQRELDVATRIQTSFLPNKFPPFPDRNDFEIYAQMVTAKEVGGDFYDFFLIDENKLGLVIGDVAGKGVPAALFMAMTRAMMKATALKGGSERNCMRDVNRILYLESMPSMFVTVFLGVLNTNTGEFEFCNGGHHPPYLLHNNGDLSSLESTGGMALGLVENVQYSSKKIALQPGDSLYFYTDGVTEMMDHAENEYTEERMEKVLRSNHEAPPEKVIEALIDDIDAFTNDAVQSDDLTLMGVKFLSPYQSKGNE